MTPHESDLLGEPGKAAAETIAAWLGALIHGSVEAGLSDAEISRAEEAFELTFPPLWRTVLGLVHPVERYVAPAPGRQPPSQYPDWRLRDVRRTRYLIGAPVAGVLFDVEENDFWWYAWGAAPASIEDRLTVARRELARVPVLLPLFGHLAVGATDDSPVFRIVQTHISIYRRTLAGLPEARPPVIGELGPVGAAPFWSDLYAYRHALGRSDPAAARFVSQGTGGFEVE